MSEPLLDVQNLKAHFFTRAGVVKAVNGASFSVHKGQTLGIVGESGSGKSVSQMSYLGLIPSPPLRIVDGTAKFKGTDLLRMNHQELRAVRGAKVAFIFQEPMTSLNPYLRISTQLIEPVMEHQKLSKTKALKIAEEALDQVGIADTQNLLESYPHEFSGGMRQRVMIAMALTSKPELLIADEPTTALDVTVQAQILDLLKDIQKQHGMAIILITHDLGVIASVADNVMVMYGGRVFEQGTAEQVFSKSPHPYTQALLQSTPRLDTKTGALPTIPGAPPDLRHVGEGCPFYDRCAHRVDICKEKFPVVRQFSLGHDSYCHVETLS